MREAAAGIVTYPRVLRPKREYVRQKLAGGAADQIALSINTAVNVPIYSAVDTAIDIAIWAAIDTAITNTFHAAIGSTFHAAILLPKKQGIQ